MVEILATANPQPLRHIIAIKGFYAQAVKLKSTLIAALLLTSLMPAQQPQRILVHAHRGGRALRPENTLPAFEYAIATGADVLELDLGVTKDNVVVVSHDSVLNPPICSGPKPNAAIRTLTLSELKQWDCGGIRHPQFERQQTVPGARIPTLDEVFALAPRGKFEFNIETKIDPREPALTPEPEEFARLVLASIRKFHLESRVMVQSFDFRTLHAMHKLAPEIRLVGLYTGIPQDFVDIARAAGTKIVSPEHHLVTPEQVKAAHAAGLQVVPWTANTPADWDRLRTAQVDAIITDDPAGLIAHLKK